LFSIHILKRSARLVALLTLSLALCGCLASRRPLFSDATAVAALGDGGRYVAYERAGAGYARDETMTMRRHGAGYDYVDEKGKATPVTFHPLAKNLFIAQARSDEGGYIYARLRMSGTTGYIEAADCDKQDAPALAALGVVTELSQPIVTKDQPSHDCILDGVQDPQKVFSTLVFSEPTSKFVRQ
jgi:hypothetical protein